MENVQVQATLSWIAVQEVDGGWVAQCLPLRLTAEGESRDELESVIAEIIDDWFRARIVQGDLSEMLSKLGWAPDAVPIPIDPGNARFLIPSPIQVVDHARFAAVGS